MIMAGYEFRDEKPFKNVYFTGIVRDNKRRKMSKSLGNSPDALKLIDDYGADGVRDGLMLRSAAGIDLLFDVNLSDQGKSIALNKAIDLGLDACVDCPGCKCGVGIDLKNKVIKPLLEAAKDKL